MKNPKLFGTNGIRFILNVDFDIDFVSKISQVLGVFFKKGPILVGYDGRNTSKLLSDIISNNLNKIGVDVDLSELIPTPALQYSIKTSNYNGGVMVTASHNPPEYSGIKVISNDGVEIDRDDEKIIEKLYYDNISKSDWSLACVSLNSGTLLKNSSVRNYYVDGVLNHVNVELIKSMNFKIVIDSGNGVQMFTAPTLLKKLGCTIYEINNSLDGNFPGRGPEPIPDKLSELKQVVLEKQADLGIAYDGDGDRSIFCDSHGNFYNGDIIGSILTNFLMSKYDSKLNYKPIIVTPISSSKLIDDISEKYNAQVIRTKVGSVDVSRIIISNNAIIGFEENGGFIYSPHQSVRDGGITSALILEMLSHTKKSLLTLSSDYPILYQFKTKINFNKNKLTEILNKLLELEYENIEKIDGLKLWFNSDTWVLIRSSGTEPAIRIFAESNDKNYLNDVCSTCIKIINESID